MKKPSTKPALCSVSYLNGTYLPEATICADDRALLYGDGLFATIHIHEGEPLFFEDHIEQLRWQCKELRLEMPTIEREIIDQLIKRNQLEGTGRLRIILTGGNDPSRGLPPRKGSLAITLEPFTLPEKKPLRLARYSTPLSLPHAHLKTLANYNRYFIMEEALSRGFDDGISLSPEGYILEASFGNLFWIKNETLYTPARTLPLYFGVTLQNVIKKWKGDVKEVKVKEIEGDVSLYRSSSMQGIVPVTSLEETVFKGSGIFTDHFELV